MMTDWHVRALIVEEITRAELCVKRLGALRRLQELHALDASEGEPGSSDLGIEADNLADEIGLAEADVVALFQTSPDQLLFECHLSLAQRHGG